MDFKNVFKKKDKRTLMDKEIEAVVTAMSTASPDTAEYTTMVKNLETLTKAKELNAKKPEKKTISPDTVAVIAGNLLGIVLVLNYEKMDVISSKAFSHILKTKI